jgi:hypothetical protein
MILTASLIRASHSTGLRKRANPTKNPDYMSGLSGLPEGQAGMLLTFPTFRTPARAYMSVLTPRRPTALETCSVSSTLV